MKNKWVIILAAFLVGAGILFYYINTTLPEKIKELVNQHAQRTLHRQVTFQDIEYHFPKGIRIKGLTVYRKDQIDAPFVYVPEINFNILLPAIIKDKRIIIPSVEVSEPFVHVIRETQSVWNFSDLLQRPSSSGESPQIFIGSIAVRNGRVKFTDNAGVAPSVKNIEAIDLLANLSLKKGIKYDLSLKVPEEAASLKTKGEFLLANKSLKARVEIQNAAAENYLIYFPRLENLKVHKGLIHSAAADIEGTLTDWSAQLAFQADVIFDWRNTHVEGRYASDGIMLTRQKSNLGAAGKIISERMFLTTGEVTVNGHAFLEDMLMLAADDSFKLNTKIRTTDSVISFPQGNFRGDVTAESIVLLRTGADIDAAAKGLVVPQAQLRYGDHAGSGDIHLSELSFSRSGEDIKTSAAGKINGLQFKSPGLTASGMLTITPLTVSRLRDGTVIRGRVQWDKALLQAGGGSLAGDLQTENLDALISEEKISVKSDFKTSGLKLAKNNLVLQGSPSGRVALSYFPPAGKMDIQDGFLELASAALSGVPQTGPVTGIRSRIEFRQNTLFAKQLSATLLGMTVNAGGSLRDPFGQRIADIQARIPALDLQNLPAFLKPYLDRLEIQPEGTLSALAVGYTGELSRIDPLNLQIEAGLKDVVIKGAKMPSPVSGLNGEVRWKDQSLFWEELSGVFQGKIFRSSGKLTDIRSPQITAELDYPPFHIQTAARKISDVLEVERLTVTLGKSRLSGNGSVTLKDFSNPDISLKAVGTVHFSDLKTFDLLKEKLSGIPVETAADVDVFFRGRPKNWREGRINFRAGAPSVGIAGYRAADAEFRFQQDPQQTDTFSLNANVYGGSLMVDGTLETLKEGFPFRGRGQLTNLNVAGLKADTKLKDSEIAGDLSVNMVMSGDLSAPESYTGQGALSIQNGHLWKFNLLKGLAGILLIPEFENFVFSDAFTEFSIHDKKVWTNSLVLTGNKADLVGKGWIGFNKEIKLAISPKFKEIEILKSDSKKKDLTAFLTQTHGYITINVTGTLDSPKYAVEKSPVKVLERTTGTIIEGVQDIFEGILSR